MLYEISIVRPAFVIKADCKDCTVNIPPLSNIVY